MDDSEYGQRLQVARKAKGWTQEQLADAIGRSTRMVRLYEKGSSPVEGPLRDLIRSKLGPFDEEGDPVIIAVKRSRLIDWRQSDVIRNYQKNLYDQDEADKERGTG